MVLLGLLFVALAIGSFFLAFLLIDFSDRPTTVDTSAGVLGTMGGCLLIVGAMVLLSMALVAFLAA